MSKHKEFIPLTATDVKRQLYQVEQVTFEVTDACNLSCKYCGYGEMYEDHDVRTNQKFSVEKALLLLDYLRELWTERNNNRYEQLVYISFYGGEPLLNVDFIRTVKAYVDGWMLPNKQFVYSMTTNGTLLDRYADFLVESDMQLLISLDGNRENNSYRVDHSGNSSFEQVFRNVQMLRERYPLYFERRVSFNAVLHSRNSVEEIFRFIRDECGKIPAISEVNTTGVRPDKRQQFLQTYRNSYESMHESESYEELQDGLFMNAADTYELALYLHKYSGNTFSTYNGLLYDQPPVKNYPTGTCMPFGKKIFVTVNGKILPCERIGQQYALGWLTNNEVIIDYEDIALRYNEWFSRMIPQCATCYCRRSCIQCIFNLEELDREPVCKGYMDKARFEAYQTGILNFLRDHPHLYEKIMKEVVIR